MALEARRPLRPVAYADSGVNIDAGNALVEAIKPLVRSTRRPGADAELGGFGGLFDLKAAGYRDPVLVAATDGVGTKLRVAIDTGILDTVGIDLVAMSVNDLVVQGAEPLIFLDYFATGQLEPAMGARIIAGVAEGCRQAGCALIGGETAEMPGIYAGKDFDLAGFAVGAVERDGVLPRPDVVAGDVRTGARFVRRPLQRLLAGAQAGRRQRPRLRGPGAVRQCAAAGRRSAHRDAHLCEADAWPRSARPGAVKAMAHITGGGITENVPRVLPADTAARIDLDALPVPPVFRWLAGLGDIAGGRDAAHLQLRRRHGRRRVSRRGPTRVAASLRASGETVVAIGCIEARTGAAVVYDGKLDLGSR